MFLSLRRFAFFCLLPFLVLSAPGRDRVAPERGGLQPENRADPAAGRERRRSAGARRTRLTEDELNSWFMYRAQPVLPAGVSQPQITIVGEGQLAGQATIDLDAVAKRRSSGAAPSIP